VSFPKALLAAAALALSLSTPALAAAPSVTAHAFLVEDGATGQILAQHAARAPVPIASITKLMTVLVALDRLQPTQVVTVPAEATTVGESSIYLRAGERIRVFDLVEGALIPSANDAADTLAYAAGNGSEARFVRLMNARARRLGLEDTHFARPDGLDAPGHLSSARDVTKLARVLMRRPLVRRVVRQTSAEISGGRTIETRNNLLSTFRGAFGVKTGHTGLAGWSEVAAARRNGVTIYATILGSPSEAQRDADLARLLEWGFSQYRAAPLVAANRVYARLATGYGRAPVGVVATRPLVRRVRVGRPLVERVVLPDVVPLPVERGTRVGEVSVYSGSRLLGSRPLVVTRSVSRPGAADRVGWYIGRTFHNLLGFVS
jgi:D-alanyl-D-alanine carboxypeptidase (penicillin-binding protein 5/6)